jgi:hypothetical protein
MSEFKVIALLRKLLVIVGDRHLAFDVRCARAQKVIDEAMKELQADDLAMSQRDVIEPERTSEGDIIFA